MHWTDKFSPYPATGRPGQSFDYSFRIRRLNEIWTVQRRIIRQTLEINPKKHSSLCFLGVSDIHLFTRFQPKSAAVPRCKLGLGFLINFANVYNSIACRDGVIARFVVISSTKDIPMTRLNGTVKFFNATKGFGFITPDNGGKDHFVHISAVQNSGVDGLYENDKVSYEAETGRDGRESAINLVLDK